MIIRFGCAFILKFNYLKTPISAYVDFSKALSLLWLSSKPVRDIFLIATGAPLFLVFSSNAYPLKTVPNYPLPKKELLVTSSL